MKTFNKNYESVYWMFVNQIIHQNDKKGSMYLVDSFDMYLYLCAETGSILPEIV